MCILNLQRNRSVGHDCVGERGAKRRNKIRFLNILRYNDSPDADFIIGRCAGNDSLLLATGDSGHGYKVRIIHRHGKGSGIEVRSDATVSSSDRPPCG